MTRRGRSSKDWAIASAKLISWVGSGKVTSPPQSWSRRTNPPAIHRICLQDVYCRPLEGSFLLNRPDACASASSGWPAENEIESRRRVFASRDSLVQHTESHQRRVISISGSLDRQLCR